MKSFLLKLIDTPKENSLEDSIFHNFSLILLLLTLVALPSNYLQNMPPLHIVTLFISTIIAFIIYILFRYKNIKFTFLYLILAILILITLWFLNGGSYGSTPYYFAFTLVCSIILIKKEKKFNKRPLN